MSHCRKKKKKSTEEKCVGCGRAPRVRTWLPGAAVTREGAGEPLPGRLSSLELESRRSAVRAAGGLEGQGAAGPARPCSSICRGPVAVRAPLSPRLPLLPPWQETQLSVWSPGLPHCPSKSFIAMVRNKGAHLMDSPGCLPHPGSSHGRFLPASVSLSVKWG